MRRHLWLHGGGPCLFGSKRIALWAMVAATGSLVCSGVVDTDGGDAVTVRVRAWVLAFALLPSAGYSQTDSSVDSNPKVQQRLQELEAMKKDLLRKMQDLDNRVQHA